MIERHIFTAEDTDGALGELVGGVVAGISYRIDKPTGMVQLTRDVMKVGILRNNFCLEPGVSIGDPIAYLDLIITNAGVENGAVVFRFDNAAFIRMSKIFANPPTGEALSATRKQTTNHPHHQLKTASIGPCSCGASTSARCAASSR